MGHFSDNATNPANLCPIWCGGTMGSFKGRHDSFCTMNTGAASVFLQSLAAYFWSPPNDDFEAV
jgi:hypothetical protein